MAQESPRDNLGRPIYGVDQAGLPWSNVLATVVYPLIDPNERVSQDYPHLHRVICRRFHDAMIARGYAKISRCTHVDEDGVRYDSPANQGRPLNLANGDDTPENRWLWECQDVMNTYERTGFLGQGTFASVYSAREQPNADHLWAIKMERMRTNITAHNTRSSPRMTRLTEGNGEVRYVPREALLLLLLQKCERFPNLNSVYSDKRYSSVIMDAFVDEVERRDHLVEPQLPQSYQQAIARTIPIRTGVAFMDHKNPVLNEIQSCKVASQLLDGYAALRDMNISHADLSQNNYIIKEDCETYLIDLGLLDFGLDDADFQVDTVRHIPFREYQVTPELAMEHTKLGWHRYMVSHGSLDSHLPHDVRRSHLWELACLIYEVLHGYAPWETPTWDPQVRGLRQLADPRQVEDTRPGILAARARRDRIINEELPIHEDMSQDCADMLRMAFVKDPASRPTLTELEAIPWFGQWSSHPEGEFHRPWVPGIKYTPAAMGV